MSNRGFKFSVMVSLLTEVGLQEIEVKQDQANLRQKEHI